MKIICQIFFMIMVFYGCENTIEPFSIPENNFAVYCMLDSRAEVNLVRLKMIHLPGNKKYFIGNTSVLLSENEGKYHYLNDTVLLGSEFDRTYKIPGDLLKRDKIYRLSIISDSMGQRWADCYFPKKPDMEVFQNGDASQGHIYLNLSFPRASHEVIYFRMILDYELTNNGLRERKMTDIPYMLYINDKSPFYEVGKEIWLYKPEELSSEIYPLIQFAGDTVTNCLKISGDKFIRTYSDTMFQYVLKNMGLKYGGQNIKIKGGLALFYQLDKNYYTRFYLKENALSSVRTDEGYYYTNFKGAENNYGFFGAMAVDTIRYRIPSGIIRKFGIIDDQ